MVVVRAFARKCQPCRSLYWSVKHRDIARIEWVGGCCRIVSLQIVGTFWRDMPDNDAWAAKRDLYMERNSAELDARCIWQRAKMRRTSCRPWRSCSFFTSSHVIAPRSVKCRAGFLPKHVRDLEGRSDWEPCYMGEDTAAVELTAKGGTEQNNGQWSCWRFHISDTPRRVPP